MLSLEQIKGRHIAVCTPCYGGQLHQNYVLSVLGLVHACMRHQVTLSFILRGSDSLIPRARNMIAAEFMATEGYTHLLWIDADIGFEPSAVFRLLQADRDVVAGIYPMKQIAWPDVVPAGMTGTELEARSLRYPFNPIDGRMEADPDGFAEVLDAPTGLMLIKREVFPAMIAAFPDHKIVVDRSAGGERERREFDDYQYRFFDVMVDDDGRYLSEDYAFCRRWRALGGKIYVDLISKLSHQGQMLYRGNFLQKLTIQ